MGEKVIAVGSVDNRLYPTVYTARDSNGNTLKYSGNPWPVSAPKTGLKVYDITKLAANASSPLGYVSLFSFPSPILLSLFTLSDHFVNTHKDVLSVLGSMLLPVSQTIKTPSSPHPQARLVAGPPSLTVLLRMAFHTRSSTP